MSAPAGPRVALIVARADNGIIGCDNQLPWRLPEDLRYFKRVTMGKPVIMGRNTFESIGFPLKGRVNYVLTRQPNWNNSGVVVVSNLCDAISEAGKSGANEIMIIGGTQIYHSGLPLANRIYLTEVHDDFTGDASFPDLDPEEWQEVSRKDEVDRDSGLAYSFVTLDRVRKPHQ